MFNIHTDRGDEEMNIRMLIELSTITMQGIEDINFDTLFACPLQHNAGVAA
ncbi:MAG: hypothetical protein ACTS73_01185 [Arsenophonus sp. NEOnobi-MAG3]